jgi:hypothetical protein
VDAGDGALIFGPQMNLQAPPNLTPQYASLIAAGLNDWGGVVADHARPREPEAPWPQIVRLQEHTEQAGKVLVERLAVYPQYARDAARWQDRAVITRSAARDRHARLRARRTTGRLAKSCRRRRRCAGTACRARSSPAF